MFNPEIPYAMKKILLFFAVFTAFTAQAQTLNLGVKGGVDLNRLTFSSSALNVNNRTGYFIGPTLKLTFGSGLGFDLSGLLGRKETEVLPVTEGYEPTVIKQTRFSVPLNVRYSIALGRVGDVFVFAGPQIAYNIGKSIHSFDDARQEVSQWRLRDSFCSVNVGGGLTLGHLQLTANYQVGVGRTGDVTFKEGIDAARDGWSDKAHNKSWQLALAYFF